MQNRRNFLKYGALFSVGAAIPSISLAGIHGDFEEKLCILHTNDWHSRIDPFPVSDPKFPGRGGAARRAALINNIRKTEKQTLLLDAGDIFQGTPYFNFYGGELEFKLMSEMGYDAATLGNHDFDNAVEGLIKQLPFAKFPFINSNYDFTDSDLKGKVLPYKVIKKGALKIGIFGLGIELDGLVPKGNYQGIIYNDPIEHANKTSEILKMDKRCDLVICLSHLGYRYESKKISDRVVAANTKYIDLIIGGHTHTFLDEPELIPNQNAKTTLVTQMGWAGLKLGRLDYVFKEKKGNLVVALVKNENIKKSIAI